MKMTLTMSEIVALVRTTWELPTDCEVVIEGVGENPAALQLVSRLIAEDCLTPFSQIRHDKKIASIKLLRELVGNGCGLAHAKYAIEDWDRFLAYVRVHGYPKMTLNDEPHLWIFPAQKTT
jgi:ribosomal protein L7/L12